MEIHNFIWLFWAVRWFIFRVSNIWINIRHEEDAKYSYKILGPIRTKIELPGIIYHVAGWEVDFDAVEEIVKKYGFDGEKIRENWMKLEEDVRKELNF